MNYFRMKFIKIKEHLFPSNPNLPDNVEIPLYQSRKYSREQRDWRRGLTLRLYRNREKDEVNNKDKQEERETGETERAERLRKQWIKGPPKRPFGINVPKDKQWKIAAKKARDTERQDKLRAQRRLTITEQEEELPKMIRLNERVIEFREPSEGSSFGSNQAIVNGPSSDPRIADQILHPVRINYGEGHMSDLVNDTSSYYS